MDRTLLNITNYREHPTDPRYTVFIFKDENMAHTFEELLNERKLAFSKEFDEDGPEPRTLFAIRRTHMETAIRLNYEAYGRHRKPSMDYVFRYGLMAFVAILLIIALYAYYTSK